MNFSSFRLLLPYERHLQKVKGIKPKKKKLKNKLKEKKAAKEAAAKESKDISDSSSHKEVSLLILYFKLILSICSFFFNNSLINYITEETVVYQ